MPRTRADARGARGARWAAVPAARACERRTCAGRAPGSSCAAPSVMRGYFGDAAGDRARRCATGWLDTGDLGFVARRRAVRLPGRAKDVVILRGANHAPQEFEEALDGHRRRAPGLRGRGGLRARRREGEELALLVETRGRRTRDARGGIRARGDRAHRRPPARRSRLLEPGTLPRTSSGKLRRARGAAAAPVRRAAAAGRR